MAYLVVVLAFLWVSPASEKQAPSNIQLQAQEPRVNLAEEAKRAAIELVRQQQRQLGEADAARPEGEDPAEFYRRKYGSGGSGGVGCPLGYT